MSKKTAALELDSRALRIDAWPISRSLVVAESNNNVRMPAQSTKVYQGEELPRRFCPESAGSRYKTFMEEAVYKLWVAKHWFMVPVQSPRSRTRPGQAFNFVWLY